MAARLPLDPFERLMVADARWGYPMCFFVEMSGSGRLDRERFATAVRAAAARHPRLRSRRTGLLWPVWRAPDREPAVESVDVGSPWRPIDLRRESAARFVIVGDGSGSAGRWRVVLMMHHAACDGLAACEIWGDVWTLYHGGRLPPFREGGIRSRAPTVATAPAPASPSWWQSLRDFAALLPQPLRSPAHRRPATAGGDPYATLVVDEDRANRLRTAALGLGGTFNDVVVAASLRAAAAWNERHGGGGSHRPLRVNMPVSLRPLGARLPAVNAIGYAFFDRTVTECREIRPLVASVAAASRWVQDTGAAGEFVRTVGWLAAVPGLLRVICRVPGCLATLVASNIGDLGRRMRADIPHVDRLGMPGGLCIERAAGVPPIRPGTAVALGIVTYGCTTTISALADTSRLGGDAAGAFLGLVDEELERITAAAVAAGEPVAAVTSAGE